MKRTQPARSIDDWLAAEADGRPDDADRLLRDVMRAVPRLLPGAGFADRVVAAAGLASPVPSSGLWSRWWVRAALGTAMVLVALAVGSLSGASVVSVGVALADGASHGIVWTWGWVGSWAAAGWSVWTVLAQVGAGAAAVITTPSVAAFLAMNLVVAAAALAALRRLLVLQEG